jgi:hypothetical protein
LGKAIPAGVRTYSDEQCQEITCAPCLPEYACYRRSTYIFLLIKKQGPG